MGKGLASEWTHYDEDNEYCLHCGEKTAVSNRLDRLKNHLKVCRPFRMKVTQKILPKPAWLDLEHGLNGWQPSPAIPSPLTAENLSLFYRKLRISFLLSAQSNFSLFIDFPVESSSFGISRP